MLSCSGALLIAQAGADGGSGPVASSSATEIQSVLDFVMKGGVMMIPIGICSLIALTVFVERMVTLRRGRVIPRSFLPGLHSVMRKHPGQKDQALVYCRKNGSPVAHVFAAGIRKVGGPLELVEKHIEDAGEREVLRLRRYLRGLSVIAAVTPLMGLLGTIFGMISAFQTVAISGEALGKTEMLAGGIYEAMITTAAGLIVAIPVLIGYHWLSARIERLVMDIDQMTVDFIEVLAEAPSAASAETEMKAERAESEDAPAAYSAAALKMSSP
ncbi:MAG: MotA/TolQ/ExbB proton channel family protein [Planctomycetota bacterium]|jgi:biopolymer transport protein ExbB